MKWRGPTRSKLVDCVSKEAFMRQRGVDPTDLGVSLGDDRWTPPTVKNMREWTSEMNNDIFKQGCVAEKFVYIYSLFMCAGPGGAGKQEWCVTAVADAEVWLEGVM
jgi:hypothetical protein